MFKSTPVPFSPGAAEPVFNTYTGSVPRATGGDAFAPAMSSVMEAANRGERPTKLASKEVLSKREVRKKTQTGPITASKLKSKLKKGKKGRKKR